MNKNIVAIALLSGTATCALAQSAAVPASDPGIANQSCVSCSIQPGDSAYAGQAGVRVNQGGDEGRRSVFTVEPGAAGGEVSTGAERASNAAHLLGRTSYIGPAGDFGAVKLGRQYTLDYLSVSPGVVASRAENAATAAVPGVAAGRTESSLQSYSTQAHGIEAGAAYGVDRFDGSRASRAWGLSLGFDVGPVTIGAAHQNRHVANIHLYDSAGNNLDARNSILSANVRMSWGTAYAAYSVNRGWGSSPLFNPDNPYSAGVATMPSTDSRDVLAGIAVPLGHSTTLLASVIHKDDRDLANRDANQFAIGASYTMSRTTDFYAAFSRIHSMGSAGIPVGYTGGTTAINLGMRHAF